ncbi:hypothetical protein CT090_20825 [Salmonella enterica subsp. enterica]|nr:hypothetical protein [Salmonella enterica subsp. enterica]EHI3195908.1 hypothetical protein [Salmonella enterica]
MTVTDKLFQALNLWVELTGIDPDANSFTVRMGAGLSDLTIKRMHEQLRESQTLDPSGITTYLLLIAFSETYFINRSFSVEQLLNAPQNTQHYLQKSADFLKIINSDEVSVSYNRFTEKLTVALKQYGLYSDGAKKVLADISTMAMIRRDALKSFQELSVSQFTRGAQAETDRFSWLNTVHQFWNINSLLDEAVSARDGITLNLVRDPSDFYSYFAFTVKNGGNLFVLSDHPQHTHPMQRGMSRRPDREFDERAGRHWFPYQLLKFKYDEDAQTLYRDRSTDTDLVPRQLRVQPVCQLQDLEARQVIWIALMFELIADKYWQQGWQAKALSYTAEMIASPALLADKATRAGMPVLQSQLLTLPELTVEEFCADSFHQTIDAADGGKPHNWLVARYGQKVSPEVLNLVKNDEHVHYLHSVKSGHSRSLSALSTVTDVHQIASMPRREYARLASWEKEGRYELTPLSAVQFGEAGKLDSDRRYIARYNFAKAVTRLADAEYERTHEEIKAWWQSSLEHNAERLCAMATEETIWLDDIRRQSGSPAHPADHILGRSAFMNRYASQEDANRNSHYFAEHYLTAGYDKGHLCYLMGSRASWFIHFRPRTSCDLAVMAGCRVDELPEVLQHWSDDKDYRGNAILDRIDPAAWAIRDPWSRNFRGTVTLALSKRAMNRLMKEHGKA